MMHAHPGRFKPSNAAQTYVLNSYPCVTAKGLAHAPAWLFVFASQVGLGSGISSGVIQTTTQSITSIIHLSQAINTLLIRPRWRRTRPVQPKEMVPAHSLTRLRDFVGSSNTNWAQLREQASNARPTQ
jgi:hypothetical protein